MARRPNLTAAQIDQIADLRENKHWSMRKIARHLNISSGAVEWRCLVDAIDKPGAPLPVSVNRGPMVVSRGDGVVRRFTPDEDDRLQALARNGERVCSIARALNRRTSSLRGRLATLARQAERAEQSQ